MFLHMIKFFDLKSYYTMIISGYIIFKHIDLP